MMTRFAVLLCVPLLLPGAAWSRQPSPRSTQAEVLTLEAALDLAWRDNRPLKNASLEVQKAEDEVFAAKTHYLPVLSLDVAQTNNLLPETYTFPAGSLGYLGPFAIPTQEAKIDARDGLTSLVSANVNQPILQLYRVHLSVRERELNRDLAREQRRSQHQSVTDDVKRSYYGILQTVSALRTTEESIKYHVELDGLMERYLKEMRVLKADSLEAKAQLARARHEAFALQNTLATQKEQLNDLLGRDIRIPFEVADVPDITLSDEDLETAQSRAVEQRPEVREAKIKAQKAEYEKKIKKSEFIPDLSLRFSYVTAPNVEYLPESVAVVGLYLRWEFYDWGRKHREVSEKDKAIQQANNQVLESKSRVVIDLNNQYRKMQEARSLLNADALAVDAAREKLRVMLQKYSQDASLLSEVLRSESALATANQQYRQALLSYWTARADFEKALGED